MYKPAEWRFLNVEFRLGGSISLAVIFIVLWTKKWDVTNWRHIRPNTTQSKELSKSPFLPSSFSSLSLQHYKYPLCCVIGGTITTITFYNVQSSQEVRLRPLSERGQKRKYFINIFTFLLTTCLCIFLQSSVKICFYLSFLKNIAGY